MPDVLILALIIAGLVLALVAEFIAKGRDITAWAVILLALALLLPRLT